VQGTHADAGIVISPGGDYVLVEYLHQNGDWLQSSVSFPILREISRAVYNYFNYDHPYLGDALAEEQRLEEDAAGLPVEASGEAPDDSDTASEGTEGGGAAEPQQPTATPTTAAANQ
jgi:hypothetical protein